jgi:hypothetical protein
MIRLLCVVIGIFFSVQVIRAIRDGKLDVGLSAGAYIVIHQNSDTAVFWGIVVFMALIAAAVFYAAIFGKDGPHA